MNFLFLKNNKVNASILNVTGTCIYTWFMFRTILMNLSTTLYTSGGDGIKNYYTYLYHCLYGKGTEFKGMNFPFYEHVIYTDNQPLLAVPLSYLRDIFHLTLGDFIAIMNMTFPFAFILSSYILFKLLSKLDINLYLSAIFGLVFTAMSPNLFKTFGHFGMSYSFFMIGSIYLVISYFKNQKIHFLILLFLLNFLVTFLHVYDFAITSLTILTLCMGCLIFEKDVFIAKIKKIVPLIGVVAASFLCFKLFLLMTDAVIDRPKNPWGVLEYVSKLKYVFTSNISNLGNSFLVLFHEKMGGNLEEGYDYIGFIPSLFCFFLILNFILFIFQKQIIIEPIKLTTVQKIFIFSGVLCLLFSMGIPFVWNMEFLLDYIGLMKQFRALGRFSWPFYFCISIATLISIDFFLKNLLIEKKKYFALTSICLLLLISALEMFSYGTKFQERCDDGLKNYKGFMYEIDSIKLFNKQVHIGTQFQGMIVLPFFLEGSDKVGAQSYGHILNFSYQYALATNIPIMNTLLARSSWSQSFDLIRFIGGPLTNKENIKKITTNKPLLVLVEKNAALIDGENYLVQSSKLIGDYKNWKFYNLSLEKLFYLEKLQRDSILKNTFIHNPTIYHESFEGKSSAEHFWGNKSLDVSTIDSLRIFDDSLKFENGTELEFSLWTSVNKEDFNMPFINLYFLNNQKKITRKESIWAFHSTDNNKLWFRMDIKFTKTDSTNYLMIDFLNYNKKCATAIDEIEIRDVKTNSFYKKNNQILFNNHIINN